MKSDVFEVEALHRETNELARATLRVVPDGRHYFRFEIQIGSDTWASKGWSDASREHDSPNDLARIAMKVAAERGYVLCIARAHPRYVVTGLSDPTGGWIAGKAYEAFAPVPADELVEGSEPRRGR